MFTLIRLIIATCFLAIFVNSSEGQMFRASGSGSSTAARSRSAAQGGKLQNGGKSAASRKAPQKAAAADFRATQSAHLSSGGWFSSRWYPRLPASTSLVTPQSGLAGFSFDIFGNPVAGTGTEGQSVPEGEQTSVLLGSGVSISGGSSPYSSSWSTAYQPSPDLPLPAEETVFRNKLREVKGQPPAAELAGAEPGIPTATPVRGKPGFVELSFDSRGLPYVDVRGLEPGSEVQIVDPLDVSKTIRFRIPENPGATAK